MLGGPLSSLIAWLGGRSEHLPQVFHTEQSDRHTDGLDQIVAPLTQAALKQPMPIIGLSAHRFADPAVAHTPPLDEGPDAARARRAGTPPGFDGRPARAPGQGMATSALIAGLAEHLALERRLSKPSYQAVYPVRGVLGGVGTALVDLVNELAV